MSSNLLGKRARINEDSSSSFKLSPCNYQKRHLRDPSNLPLDILMQILLTLSAEDLQNLKFVSKFWFDLISQPRFVDTHLIRYCKNQPKQLLFSTVTKPTNINKNDVYRHFAITNIQNQEEGHINIKELKLQLPKSKFDHIEGFSSNVLALQSSCDGLFLLQNMHHLGQLYITNPITSPSGFLPLPPLDPGWECSRWVLFLDTSINRYRVFGIRSQRQYVLITLAKNVMKPFPCDADWSVWSMNQEWLGGNLYVLSQLLVVQNEVHWLSKLPTKEPGVTTDRRPLCFCIFSVNVKTIHFSKAKVPLHLANPRNPHELESCKRLHLLLEINGLLCLTIVSQHLLEMFVLDDRPNCAWTKSHTISLQSLRNRPAFLGSFLLENICLVVLRGVEGNNLLEILKVLIHDEDELMLFDLKTQKIRHIGFLSKDQKLCTPYFIYSSTLVGCTRNCRVIRKC